MISRLWHGWSSPENADAYERLLRREVGGTVEFVTIMWFESLDAVRAFAGEDYERAVVPSSARELLLRFDERSAHYEVRERRSA